jgi:hypothetical protein
MSVAGVKGKGGSGRQREGEGGFGRRRGEGGSGRQREGTGGAGWKLAVLVTDFFSCLFCWSEHHWIHLKTQNGCLPFLYLRDNPN